MIGRFDIIFYESAKGNIPVANFLEDVSNGNRAKVARVLDLFEEFGLSIGFKYVKKLSRGLWELRIKGKNSNLRILFTVKGRGVILLHAFEKKTQKIPKNDLKVAKARLNNL